MVNTDKPITTSRRMLVDYPRGVPLIIFIMIAAITCISVWAIERGENARRDAALLEKSHAISTALERRVDATDSYLRAGSTLFGTVDDVTPRLFRRFVSELRIDGDYRGAEGIGWANALTGEEALSADYPGAAPVFPVPSADRDLVTPVTFLQPDTPRNRLALGYDMYSNDVRRMAMDQARNSVRPTATGPLVLLQEGGAEVAGFIVYMPVFEGVGNERMLRGFIYSPFSAPRFLDSAVPIIERDRTKVSLYGGDLNEDSLLATIGEGATDDGALRQSVRIADRDFILTIARAAQPSLSQLSMITLLFGIAVASLLMVVARLLTQQAMEDRAALAWLEEQNSIRNSLTRELNHRVKNTLANVLSILSLTRRRSTTLAGFADSLDGRIRALSATHDLLTQSEWGTTAVRAVIEAELAPYVHSGDRALELSGPSVELSPSDALSLGLAIHELATNAAKFGALSVAEGKVSVIWTLINSGLARIDWVESDGPSVPTERARGFGSDLIEKIVAHELRHPVNLDFAPEGVRCTLLVPVREMSEFALRARLRSENAANVQHTGS